MGVLPAHLIEELVASKRLLIAPFDKHLLQPASYDLRLGSKILASPLGPTIPGEVVELDEKTAIFQIQTGQMVSVISAERLELPLDVSARFGVRSSYTRKGILAFGGLQIDPGFRGRLVMSLQNVGPEPVTIRLNEPLFSVEFQKLEEPAREGYVGTYQDQTDFPPDQYAFILSARTTSLAEIPQLRRDLSRLSGLVEELQERLPVRRDLSRLSGLIEELQERLPDIDEGLELKPEVEERLSRSSQRPRASLLSPEEMRKRLGLL